MVAIDARDRDALPGSAVKLVKDALRIMRKRRKASTEDVLSLGDRGSLDEVDGDRAPVRAVRGWPEGF